ncbi:hypothetical protein N7468_010609 [Penicillium chermesinum]|uniref:Uncharacterized protein n=1 Tax=Penicillium chermesinum TaxID=63820 RepID=A0A9W9N7Z2_9EURO|nr:uncharacterized protein N7468_010609 [Penicillium chermesinum]KAJ5214930.1 hypothetical protein N7468_010609 [Penicillium chermesinum]
MSQRQLSRTLPKNFTFPSLYDEPKTPERPSVRVEVPPPPRHSFSSCRLPRNRVRSGTDVCARMDLDLFQFQGLPDVPLPSIEVVPHVNSESPSPEENNSNDDRYLAPPRTRMEFKTPPAQILGAPHDSEPTNPWISRGLESHGLAPELSIDTLSSRYSVGGSCTSVETDLCDSNFPLEFPKEPEMSSPTLPKKQKVKRASTKEKSWTREMDNHLWNTYQLYLQDPTLTPFKMTPGCIPPLGVTSRVARRAAKTWANKNTRITQTRQTQAADRSGSSTPKAVADKAGPVWPKSDSKTRKHLKLLCRRKFSIVPHYQRMMQSRTPEPPTNMPRWKEPQETFTTRDLGISLVSSGQNPSLAQLCEEPVSAPSEPKPEWFNQPVQNPLVPQPNLAQSQPSNQFLNSLASDRPLCTIHGGPGEASQTPKDRPTAIRRETIHVPGRRLRRAPYFNMTPADHDNVFSSSPAYGYKDPSEEEVHHRLNHYIRDQKFQDIGHGRVRIRSRGATTSGAVGPRDVNQLFSPPSSLNSSQLESEDTTPVSKTPMRHPFPSLGENIKRLGSPFKVEGGFKRREGPGRMIRHAPSLSDPFSQGIPSYPGPAENPSPILEQTKASESLPTLMNPFEEGLSDAERIRRQILNMSSTRH